MSPQDLSAYVEDILDTAKDGTGTELHNLEVSHWVNEQQEFHISISRVVRGYRKATIAIPVEQVPELIRAILNETARFSYAIDTARGVNRIG